MLYKLTYFTYFYEMLKSNNLLKSENLKKLRKNGISVPVYSHQFNKKCKQIRTVLIKKHKE